jgi:phosphinothricin acetyltransferase
MIRLVTKYDLDDINKIFNQAVEAKHQTAAQTPISKEQRLKWFQEHDVKNYPIFVIEKEAMIIGWYSLNAYRKGREALEHVAEVTYYLHKDFQRIGYGTILMDHAIITAPLNNIKVLVAILFGHNSASIKLLEKFNFKQWGNLPKVASIDGNLYDPTIYGLKI